MKANQVLAGFVLCLGTIGSTVSPDGYPSSPAPSARGLSLADAVLVERSDFRLAFCDAEELRLRIESAVCVVDLRRQRKRQGVLVSVQRGRSLAEVLKDAGTPQPSLSHPQIRVIHRNEINQSPLADGFDAVASDRSSFLQQIIHPGDIVVVTRET